MAKNRYKPKLIMSTHGFLSAGKWQKLVKEAVDEKGLISKEFNYGVTLRIDRWKMRDLVRRFRDWYFSITNDPENELNISEPYHRPSIVAHSLGTYIIALALEKYPEIKFDKIFLHGSIIPKTFDWYNLILRNQVSKVVTEISNNDEWVRLGFIFTGSIFPCSKYKFVQDSTYLKYEQVDKFRHSDFQYKERFISQFNTHLYETPVQLKIESGINLSKATLKKYFKKTSEIDTEAYGTLYSDNPIRIDQALDWADVEQDIWSFLIDSYTNKVVGYINTMPVDDSTYNSFINAKILESQIEPNNITPFSIANKFNIIILSIALDNVTRNKSGLGLGTSKPFELLIIAMANKMIKLSTDKKKIMNIGSVGWSPIGIRLCKSFGLKPNKIINQGHPVYVTTLKELRNLKYTDVHSLCKWWLKKIISQ